MKSLFKSLLTMVLFSTAFYLGFYLGQENIASRYPEFQEDQDPKA